MGLFGSVSYKKNLRRSLRENYGRTPDPFYSAGDMATIRSYYDHMREHDPDTFRVDDVTWSDLDMDRVFKRINPGVSTPGEHWLYYMLRTPAMDAEEYAGARG
jgi:DNA mismatch repair protein mutS domain protein